MGSSPNLVVNTMASDDANVDLQAPDIPLALDDASLQLDGLKRFGDAEVVANADDRHVALASDDASVDLQAPDVTLALVTPRYGSRGSNSLATLLLLRLLSLVLLQWIAMTLMSICMRRTLPIFLMTPRHSLMSTSSLAMVGLLRTDVQQ